MTLAHREPLLTVVVIGYNDALRLPRAVESVLAQTLPDVEIMIVDDASTDGTAAIAARFAAEHPGRVRCLTLPVNSGGCSRPRNVGLEAARGRYVMFLDSDDDLPPDACRTLVAAAEDAGADFSSGRCVRVHVNRGGRTDPWYPWLYETPTVLSSALENADLLYDTLSTNKCYRRSFLDQHGLRFPDGYHYEDLLFSALAYLHAQRIAIVPDVVYRWHVVDDLETPSISNRRSELSNFLDRLRIHGLIDDAFARASAPGQDEMRLHEQVKFLRHDLLLYLPDLPYRDIDYRREFLAAAREHLARFDQRALARADPVAAIAAWCIVHDDEATLTTAIDYLCHGGKLSSRLARVGDRVYWSDRHLDTDEGRAVMDVTELGLDQLPLDRLVLANRLTEVFVDGSMLRLRGEILNPLDRLPVQSALQLDLLVGPRRQPRRARELAVADLRHDGDRIHWSAELDLGRMVRAVGLVDRVWDLRGRLSTTSGTNISPLWASQPQWQGLRLPVRPLLGRLAAEALETIVTPTGDLALEFRPGTPTAERLHTGGQRLLASGAARRLAGGASRLRRAVADPTNPRVREEIYARTLARLPGRSDVAVFESEGGHRCAGNPKAVYDEIRRRGLPIEAVWAHAGDPTGFPADARLVRHGSLAYVTALARASWWVDDRGFPLEAPKRPETTYVQTWSGTPVAWLGLDVAASRSGQPLDRRSLRRQAARWDAVVVRAPHDEAILRHAFRSNVTTLPTGYPRNDRLFAPDDPEEAAVLRRHLGIDTGQQVVLHLPSCAEAVVTLDLSAVAANQALVVRPLRRGDPVVAGACDGSSYDDLPSLLRLADVLVTDHHPALWDYALLGRPSVVVGCRCPIRARRGAPAQAYLDLDAEAPGPTVWTAGELADALHDIDELTVAWRDRIERAAKTFGAYDSGTASARVVDYLLGGGSRPQPRADTAGWAE